MASLATSLMDWNELPGDTEWDQRATSSRHYFHQLGVIFICTQRLGMLVSSHLRLLSPSSN